MDFTKLEKNLTSKGYKVACFDNAKEASEYLDKTIDKTTVGIGGSMTVKEMGLYEMLKSHNDVSWHLFPENGKSGKEVIGDAAKTEIYLTSVNGLSEDGEIINIDGTCNRVSSTLYGHEKVFFIVGKNKVAENYDAALWRARNIASPLNAKRLGKKTPCAEKGDKCYDCKSRERICRALCVFWEKPTSCEMEVVLINENLGY